MKEFQVINNRRIKPYVRAVAIAFGVFLIVLGYLRSSPFGFLIGPLLIWGSFFNKQSRVTEEGVETYYGIKPFEYTEKWSFTDISGILEERVEGSGYEALLFTKGMMSRKMLFSQKDAEEIIQTAVLKNPEIIIGDLE